VLLPRNQTDAHHKQTDVHTRRYSRRPHCLWCSVCLTIQNPKAVLRLKQTIDFNCYQYMLVSHWQRLSSHGCSIITETSICWILPTKVRVETLTKKKRTFLCRLDVCNKTVFRKGRMYQAGLCIFLLFMDYEKPVITLHHREVRYVREGTGYRPLVFNL
jgi:hypothetical protein